MNDQKLQAIIQSLKSYTNVVGLILAGSTAKSLQTSSSDIDLYIIFENDTSQKEIDELRTSIKKLNSDIDLSNQALQTIDQFEVYAVIESLYEWDRYNLVHAKLLMDKTDGVLKDILQRKQRLTNNEADVLVRRYLSAYINLIYRSVRSYHSGNHDLAKLDNAEALVYLLILLFAFNKRVKPYNKYLEWELKKVPLVLSELKDTSVYDLIVSSTILNDLNSQIVMYNYIHSQALNLGYEDVYRSWGEKLNILKMNS